MKPSKLLAKAIIKTKTTKPDDCGCKKKNIPRPYTKITRPGR